MGRVFKEMKNFKMFCEARELNVSDFEDYYNDLKSDGFENTGRGNSDIAEFKDTDVKKALKLALKMVDKHMGQKIQASELLDELIFSYAIYYLYEKFEMTTPQAVEDKYEDASDKISDIKHGKIKVK